MPDYRLFFLNAEGHFMQAEVADVADDQAAMAKAREVGHAHCIEVWEGKRMVGTIEPVEKPA